MQEEYISIGKVAKKLGISISTCYRWIKSGKLQETFRTLGNHRRFNTDSVDFLVRPKTITELRVVTYARVSSHDQKEDLVRQNDKLINYAKNNGYNNIISIMDLGSGLNYKKSGLKKLLKLIMTKSIDVLILNHKDRLLRFGSELIFSLCSFYKIEVKIIEDIELNFNEELTHNVIELMTVFCAKLYGKRSHKNKLSKDACLTNSVI